MEASQKPIHVARRAIILAAGLGERLRPITDRTPKPLIMVNGKRIIDTAIDALLENNITEIYIVVGHLKERFSVLKEKYPTLRFINNAFYSSCNNIASLYAAREHLEECVILDGDQIIRNPTIFASPFFRSGYCNAWTDIETNEWLQTVEDGVVTSCNREGGKKGWQLFSVSFWTAEDGKKLKGHLEKEFEIKKTTHIYWDDVVMFCYPEEYQLGIRPITKEDIVEIDTLEELMKSDPKYKALLEGKEKGK